MNVSITFDKDNPLPTYKVERDGQVICITKYWARAVDVVADVCEHQGKLTLIPEPLEEKD